MTTWSDTPGNTRKNQVTTLVTLCHRSTMPGVLVIGVAKSAFRTATHAIAVLRGTSSRPLFVTAAGMPRTDAADLIRHMTGQHRLPDALRRVDSLARHGLPEPPRH